jgi:hypothetical protein
MKYRAVLAAMACLLVACDQRVPTEPMPVPKPSFESGNGADVYGVGGGSINFGGMKYIKFAFSAHTGPQGDFGSSRITIEDPSVPLDAHVDVDCVNVFPLMVVGAGGWFGGVVTKVTPEPNVYGIAQGDQLLFGINDFGEPSDPTPDEYTPYFGSPQACKVFGPSSQSPIDQGNINIKTG